MRIHKGLLALVLLAVLGPGRPAGAQDAFTLTQVVPSREVSGEVLSVWVSTSGPKPADVEVARYWRLRVATKGATRVLQIPPPSPTPVAVPVPFTVHWEKETSQVRIDVRLDQLQGIDPKTADWRVVFISPSLMDLAKVPELLKPGLALKAAKDKDDADLYVSGAFLAGKGTKPIWMLDAKAAVGWPTGEDRHWLALGGTLAINPGAEPPADSTDVNPDAITAFAQMDTVKVRGTKGSVTALEAIAWVFRPIAGEFASKYPTGNIMTTAEMTMRFKPFLRDRAVVRPSLGLEAGLNQQKPETLFDRPVQLENYDTIARLKFGGTANYYIFRKKPTADELYAFVLSVSYQGRALGTDEPFVRSAYVEGADGKVTRQKLLDLRGGTRHYLEAGFTWNASKLVSLDMRFKRGAQPPLFQFVEPHVVIGVTFKAKTGTDVKP